MAHNIPGQSDVPAENTKSIKLRLPKSIWVDSRNIISRDEIDWNQFAARAFKAYVETRNSEPESRAA